MFSCYRLIPHCISKNVRNLFCETTKLLPATSDRIEKLVRDCKTTEKENHVFQMLRIPENVLVLNVKTPTSLDKSVGCTIAVDVGFDNSTSSRAGMPHLLEHVISNLCNKSHPCRSDCHTERFRTVYSFETELADYDKVLKIWADRLFSKSDLDDGENIIYTERWRVHNEFNEKRLADVYGSALEILKLCKLGTHFPQFGWGNIDTLGDDADDMEQLAELNGLRRLHLQHPVVICTYSAHDLKMDIWKPSGGDRRSPDWAWSYSLFTVGSRFCDMTLKNRKFHFCTHEQLQKTILDSINVGDFLSERKPPQEDENITKPLIVPTRQNIKKPLIVATSQDGWTHLILIFPMMNKLNFQQTNTFKWIAQMISCNTDGLLVTKLRDYQWMGDKISGAIHHMKSEEEGRFNSQTNMQKSEYIATRLNGSIEEFNYDLLYSGLEKERGAHFISEHLLENKNIAHMIYDRSPLHVLDVLKNEYTDCVASKKLQEKLYDIPFYMVESPLLQTIGDNYARCCMFMWMEFKPHPYRREYYISMANPKDEALKMLFEMHFHYCFDRYELLFGGITASEKDQCLTIRTGTMESFAAFKSNTWFTEDKFSLVKQGTLAVMSRTMSSSETFAESLMETYVKNATCKKHIHPIYKQYAALINTGYKDYCGYCHQMVNSIIPAFDESQNINYQPFNKSFQLESINSNDTVTTTLIFYETSLFLKDFSLDRKQQIKKGLLALYKIFGKQLQSMKIEDELYTAKVIHQRYGNINGFLCKILSVEKIQDWKRMNKAWEGVSQKVENDTKTYNLHALYHHIIQRQIKIQVIGHKEPKINEETFEEQFVKWFENRHKYTPKN